MIKAVFIDIDNTILDFDAYVEETIRTGFEAFGICSYQPYMLEVFHEENNKLWHKIEEGTLDIEGLKKIRFNNVFNALNLTYDGEAFETYFRAQLNESAILVEGAEELLKYLSEKYIICIASNGPYNQQIHRMELSGLDKYVTYNFISEKIGAAKPSEAYFEKCFEILNENREDKILPEETVMIGDSLTADISGGVESGMKTIFFDKHKAKKEIDIKADYTVFNLSEVIQIM